MLEHITSCENSYRSPLWIAILGAIALLIGFFAYEPEKGIALIVGISCLIIYFLTRKNVLIISSPSTKIIYNLSGIKKEPILHFINRIEHTKHRRISSLHERS